MATQQVTEYWVNPLDDYGDVIDNHFCASKPEAVREYKRIVSSRQYGDEVCDYEFLKVVRKYRDDGELVSEDVTTLPARDFR